LNIPFDLWCLLDFRSVEFDEELLVVRKVLVFSQNVDVRVDISNLGEVNRFMDRSCAQTLVLDQHEPAFRLQNDSRLLVQDLECEILVGVQNPHRVNFKTLDFLKQFELDALLVFL
jgi:hypothetical protein